MNTILEAVIIGLLLWMMFRSQKQQQQIYLLFIFLALIGLHLSIGLIRWQRIPLYLSIVSFLFVQANGYLNKKLVKGILVSLLILSGIANQAFPIYPMPQPTGSLLVGTQSVILNDASRIDLYHPNEEARQFKIQLWYPTDNI